MLIGEQKEIYNEWEFIFNNQKNIEPISMVNLPRQLSHSSIFGENVRINYNNYIEDFYATSKNYNIPILLNDHSMLFFNYIFDSNGMIVEHHLTYYPCPNEEQALEDTLSKIIRVDYEEVGFVENIHSLTHLHNGKFSAYRFTVENIVFPLEFLSFILLTNYNYKFDTINSKLKTDHRLTLKNEEKGYFSLRILKDS